MIGSAAGGCGKALGGGAAGPLGKLAADGGGGAETVAAGGATATASSIISNWVTRWRICLGMRLRCCGVAIGPLNTSQPRASRAIKQMSAAR